MKSLLEPGKEVARHERAIGSLLVPNRRTMGGSPASVRIGIFAARIGCEGSFVPGGAYGVQRACNVAAEGHIVKRGAGELRRKARAADRRVW